ncbi:uncharacterized protein EV422DRAFT_534430 [Fimicolochytrium jonesii]|uniref:uncharacterized protein n=1 Tax=Fimicolochytrium jonesii TaxID=1396493 RepID=UPI0022FE7FB9|nr:uncharacterized protein EV422DRAFT_534430 [Fimicolochytrium jonesii]KAI8819355.1 hypothetical protein EV422DRAFT_534430 [Fimicolochytrium jonesii]
MHRAIAHPQRTVAALQSCRPTTQIVPSRSMSSTTSPSAKPAAGGVDLSNAASLKARHPNTVYREAMKVKRKQYFEESKQASARKELESVEERGREEQRKRDLAEKIRQFKALRSQSFSEDVTATHGGKASPVDALDGGSSAGETGSAKVKADAENKEWKEFISLRRQKRFENHVRDRVEQSEQRLESLLYLYHSTAKFITYDNLEPTIRALVAQPTTRMLSADRPPSLGQERHKALDQIMSGVLNHGMGLETLKKEAKALAESEQGGASNKSS